MSKFIPDVKIEDLIPTLPCEIASLSFEDDPWFLRNPDCLLVLKPGSTFLVVERVKWTDPELPWLLSEEF